MVQESAAVRGGRGLRLPFNMSYFFGGSVPCNSEDAAANTRQTRILSCACILVATAGALNGNDLAKHPLNKE